MTQFEAKLRFYNISSLDDKYYVLPVETGFIFYPIHKYQYKDCLLVTREQLEQIWAHTIKYNFETKQLEPLVPVLSPLEEIQIRKDKLAETDYQAIKFAEGELSAKAYAPMRAQRKQWRAEINELEKKVK